MTITTYGLPATIMILDTNNCRTTPSAFTCQHHLAEDNSSSLYEASLVMPCATTGGIYYSGRNDQYYRIWGDLFDNTDIVEASRTNRPALISIDNGYTWQTPEQLFFNNEQFACSFDAYWGQIVDRMDDELREEIHGNYGDLDELTFLTAYCERASNDICIG